MTPFDFTTKDVEVFILVMFRITGLFMFAPMFGSDVVPAPVKILLAFGLSMMFLPFVDRNSVTIGPSVGVYFLAVGIEFAVGAVLGWTASLLLTAVQLGGQLVDQELGLSLANVIDPITQEQVSVIAQLKLFLAVLIWLLLNGHHFLISALADSFKSIPLMGATWGAEATMYVSSTVFTDMLKVAFKVAAPVVVASLLMTIALAFMTRVFPELNIFSAGFNLRILLGMLVLVVAIGGFVAVFVAEHNRHMGVTKRILQFLAE